MTDGNLSPERQRELLAAVGVSVKSYTYMKFCDFDIYKDDELIDCAYGTAERAWKEAWEMYGTDALAHDWHAQAARIASLEAEVAALREQAAAPKRVWKLEGRHYDSDEHQFIGMYCSEDLSLEEKREYLKTFHRVYVTEYEVLS